MKVTLNIERDDELRAHIKDCIKGQVLSVTRGEINEVVKKEITRKIENSSDYTIRTLVEKALASVIKSIVISEMGSNREFEKFIRGAVHEKTSEIIDRWNLKKLIDEAARIKIREMAGTM